MKEIIVKELFWLVLSAAMSLVLSFLFLALLDLSASKPNMNEVEKIFSIQLYLVGCLVSMLSVYVVRIVVIAIKKYL
ncbi:hypothetical protein N8873_08795 [Flavobacteriaceae bacterium]|jgi:hypothetical protein|nr:hypothetical protein [Flavobacteriaceae bacterium]MDA8993520.1 hypothetical protein [Flavobacteriaceae bacterium]MDB4306748.1 hypothetical protein [Flavobacteriaceae bacterium]